MAIPTETYYGLAVDPFNEKALRRLFDLKKRPAVKPILTLIENDDHLALLTDSIPDAFRPLMSKFWPGPLTLIFQAHQNLPTILTGNTGTVGIRVSSNLLAREFIKYVGAPVTATSANVSGLPPAKDVKEVQEYFGSKLDFIVDADATPGGRCSTIISILEGKVHLVRDGAVSFSKIRN